MSDPSPPTPQQLVEALTDGISQLDDLPQIGAKSWMSVGKKLAEYLPEEGVANPFATQHISHSPKVVRLWLKKPWNVLSCSQTWITRERENAWIISAEQNRWDWCVISYLAEAPCTYPLIFVWHRPFKCVNDSWRSLELKMAS
jgi:hypothetical protein